jgi:CspA family cold shock protein
MTGIIKWFRNDFGYGFIKNDDYPKGIFVHKSQVCEPIVEMELTGKMVDFEISQTDRGLQATKVTLHEIK